MQILLRTTKECYHCTTEYDESVVQSTTLVLLRTTKYYIVFLRDYTLILHSTSLYYKLLHSTPPYFNITQASITLSCKTQKDDADQRNPELQNAIRLRRTAQPWVAKRNKITQNSATLSCKT